MLQRPRRLRRTPAIRSMIEEIRLSKSDFIYPVFVTEGRGVRDNIAAMPGIHRFSPDELLKELDEVVSLGIQAVALFPVVRFDKKDLIGMESYNPEGLTQKTIRLIKERYPELMLITDVALDPYTIHGHDGLLKDGKVLNDETVAVLAKMALAQADAGADIVAPSDMMDGRVKIIRAVLDKNGHQDVGIMAYTAKYASCLYGPFREALGSLGAKTSTGGHRDSETAKKLFVTAREALKSNSLGAASSDDFLDAVSEKEYYDPDQEWMAATDEKAILRPEIPEDKKTYQMNPANSREAMRELKLDLAEGADFVMVKPAGFYLDIIQQFKEKSNVPVAAYQVSGEYSMIKSAGEAGLIDLDQAIHESLVAIKRAGADLILSYFAKDIARKL